MCQFEQALFDITSMPTLEKGQSLCDSCVRGERNCPIYPQETDYCIEYRRSNKDTILELVKDMEVYEDVCCDIL